MKMFATVSVLSFAAFVLVGCGGGADETGGAGGSTSNQTKAGKDATKAPASSNTSTSADPTAPAADAGAAGCVFPGDKGNALGVGAYCQTPSECSSGTFCTAGLAPKGAEFCTLLCKADAECGEGAICYTDPRGSACVPSACIVK